MYYIHVVDMYIVPMLKSQGVHSMAVFFLFALMCCSFLTCKPENHCFKMLVIIIIIIIQE